MRVFVVFTIFYTSLLGFFNEIKSQNCQIIPDTIDDVIMIRNDGISNLLFQGSGPSYSSPSPNPLAVDFFDEGFNHVIPGDWNSDGLDDLMLVRNDGVSNIIFQSVDSVGLSYDPASPNPLTPDFFDEGFNHIIPGDWNNDGRTDVMMVRNDGVSNILLQGTNNTFSSPSPNPLSVDFFDEGFDHIIPGDWNNDGRTDVMMVRNDGVSNILLQGTNNTFSSPSPNPLVPDFFDEGFDHIIPGDWNNDGRTDVMMVRNDGVSNILLQGTNNTFSSPSPNPLSVDFFDEGFDHIIPGDWNNDGRTDVMMVRNDGVSNILLQGTNNTFSSPSPNPLSVDFFDEGFDHIIPGNWNSTCRANSTNINDLNSIPGFEILKIYPVPSVEELSISFSLSKSMQLNMALLDFNGNRLWESGTVKIYPGEYEQKISLDNLSSGIYYLQVGINGINRYRKIVVN